MTSTRSSQGIVSCELIIFNDIPNCPTDQLILPH